MASEAHVRIIIHELILKYPKIFVVEKMDFWGYLGNLFITWAVLLLAIASRHLQYFFCWLDLFVQFRRKP